jgi:taurine--2-oxoglutarate transaminase
MTGQEIVDLTKKHTLFEWSAQSKVDPIPVARAKGIYFWTPEGKRFIDFNSQLMSVNIGHGDERVIRAIQRAGATLAYANPFMATEPRARLGAKLAEITPGRHRHLLLHQRRRRSQRERHQDRAASPDATRSWRAIARITARRPAAITLTGDPRAGPRSPASRASCACSILITASSADGSTAESRWR